MKNLIITLIIAMFMTACELDYVPGMPVADYDIEIGNIYDYDFEGSGEIPEFETINDIAFWLRENFIYTIEEKNKDYWQTPEETFYRRNEENKMMGDCEDKAILFQYLIDINFNIPSFLAAIQFPNEKDLHAMVYVNNLYYEIPAEEGLLIPLPKLRSDIKIHYYIPYSEVIWMTVNYHINVGKYE